jgi:thiol-disulfide isomerase/thioredoxin
MRSAVAFGGILLVLAPAGPNVPELSASGYARRVVAARKGRPFAVNFWATWCDPCQHEMPALLAAAAARKIDLVLVSLDTPAREEEVRAFLAAHKAKRPAFRIEPGDPQPFIDAVDASWDGTVPYTLLYDAKGHIRARLLGEHERHEFEQAFAAMR